MARWCVIPNLLSTLLLLPPGYAGATVNVKPENARPLDEDVKNARPLTLAPSLTLTLTLTLTPTLPTLSDLAI